MTFTRTVLLEQGEVGFHKMQSVFAWVRLWGGPVTLAYAIQGIVTLAVAATSSGSGARSALSAQGGRVDRHAAAVVSTTA